jgi:hypothetical protein
MSHDMKLCDLPLNKEVGVLVEVAGSNFHSHTVDNLNGNLVQLVLPFLRMDLHMVLQVEQSYRSSPVENSCFQITLSYTAFHTFTKP